MGVHQYNDMIRSPHCWTWMMIIISTMDFYGHGQMVVDRGYVMVFSWMHHWHIVDVSMYQSYMGHDSWMGYKRKLKKQTFKSSSILVKSLPSCMKGLMNQESCLLASPLKAISIAQYKVFLTWFLCKLFNFPYHTPRAINYVCIGKGIALLYLSMNSSLIKNILNYIFSSTLLLSS